MGGGGPEDKDPQEDQKRGEMQLSPNNYKCPTLRLVLFIFISLGATPGKYSAYFWLCTQFTPGGTWGPYVVPGIEPG